MEPPIHNTPGSPAARSPHRPSIGSLKSPRSSSRMSAASSRHSLAGLSSGIVTSKSSDEDSKTAVKVAIRVRPPLKPTDPGFELIPQRFRGSTCEVPSPTNLLVASPQGKKLFVFDRVLDEDTTQEGVWSYLSDSVNSFVQGYNVSILAYGQSGAGKSYTMGTAGSEQVLDSSSAGVIPRAAQALFEKLHGPSQPRSSLRSPQRYSSPGLPSLSSMHRSSPAADKDWQLKATYVEIYNEHLRDLLVPESVPQAERAQVSIREDTKGRILLTGLTSVPVNSVEDILNALQFGSTIRQTDATAINAKSSRSHAIFSLNLVQKTSSQLKERRMSAPLESMQETTVTTDSKLHFVDLAGSERLKNTGAQGERAKEGISINAGLASLGKVISQLSSRHPGGYISYRDSRLTRLLQDSLGGNAITYMVACVTPAEFHLSETLNTVTYAQRARAIQSKPEIQQTHEDKDNTAKLERLQSEVAFLRDQIKHERSSEDRNTSNGDRLSARREKELQDQLMDMQESYTTLSQRHAKLIAEISRAQHNHDEEMPTVRDAIGDSAMDRLKRSNSLSEAVEQVVVEYEKTIQSLETSLSNTRSTLSNSESILMERESKIAFMENLAQQLQARLQKASDRESNNDAYLRDLETQIEGATSSEEKSASLVNSLRKELSRLKENESNSEEYISTLEERLAEAEQDQEIMQREIDRLEHVIERQRSIGRLDNLLSELDGIKQKEVDQKAANLKQVNGHDEAIASGQDIKPEAISNGETVPGEASETLANGNPEVTVSEPSETTARPMSRDEQQAAQSNFMADKLSTTMQELFDLRGEHEAAINEKLELQQKYEIALRNLAKLQEEQQQQQQQQSSADPSRRQSFLGHAGVNASALGAGLEPTSSSRSLESELSSSLQGSPTLDEELHRSHGMSTEEEDDTDAEEQSQSAALEDRDVDDTVLAPALGSKEGDDEKDMLSSELDSIREQYLGQQEKVRELTSSYAELQQQHQDTIGQMETLRADLSRANNSLRPSSPHSPSLRSPTLRRKLSQDLVSSMTSNDRATRSFASLRNIALDNFEKNIDVRQNFELNLNTIMTELHDRSHKVEALDAEIQSARRDLENNQRIITGLTRERTSLQASSGVDFTVVGQMQSQLEQSEQQFRELQEVHAGKENEWQEQFQTLNAELQKHKIAASENGSATGATDETRTLDGESENASNITRLQNELAAWEARHKEAMASMKASEAALLATIAALEVKKTEAENGALEISERHVQAVLNFDQTHAQNQEIVKDLQRQIREYQSASEAHADQLSKLEQSHSAILQQVEEHSKSKELTEQELQTHRNLVANLESQLDSHKARIAVHEANLESILSNIKTAHEAEVNKIKVDMLTAEKAANEKHAAMVEEHSNAIRSLEDQHKIALSALQQDLEQKQRDLEGLLLAASSLLGHETDVESFHRHLSDAISKETAHANAAAGNGSELQEKHALAIAENEALQKELHATLAQCAEMENKVTDLMAANSRTLESLEEVSQKELRSSRLVQELEEQITNNFDQHQAANNRLSAMHDRHLELEEAFHAKGELEKELEDARLKISLLESQLSDIRRRSLASTSRDSFTRDSQVTWNRDSLSPEAAAIALARQSSAGSINNLANAGSRPRSNHNAPSQPPGTALPSPPPAIPLPPLPASPLMMNASSIDARAASPAETNRSPPGTPQAAQSPSFNALHPVVSGGAVSALPDPALQAKLDDQDVRLRTLEKHLFAEKQLTATLEEALIDLENSANKHKTDTEGFKRRCKELEDELVSLRKEKTNSRASLQQVEEEREMRVRAERARMALEERMRELNGTNDKKKKKKGGALNCF